MFRRVLRLGLRVLAEFSFSATPGVVSSEREKNDRMGSLFERRCEDRIEVKNTRCSARSSVRPRLSYGAVERASGSVPVPVFTVAL
jgi:hypothetical protein